MPLQRNAAAVDQQAFPSLGNLLTARPAGLHEAECWALLCQAVQALQDLFLSDGASEGKCMPLVTPANVFLSARGRVRFQLQQQQQNQQTTIGSGPPPHLVGYLAPEYRPGKQVSDTEAEKMWIYGLGETLKRVTLTSHAATSRLTTELCQVLADMTRPQVFARASLIHLLDVISDYCKRRELSRPFTHICMDLHQEAMVALEGMLDAPWGPPAMPELRTLTRSSNCEHPTTKPTQTIPRRWMNIRSPRRQRLLREVSSSMEELTHAAGSGSSASMTNLFHHPGKYVRPKSMCIPEGIALEKIDCLSISQSEFNLNRAPEMNLPPSLTRMDSPNPIAKYDAMKRSKMRRNPVQRAASRLYRAAGDLSPFPMTRTQCVGPEFVVRATLPRNKCCMHDVKSNAAKSVTVILLNGQKIDVVCNPQTTTAGQLFEMIIRKEHIEENFMLGLSTLIAGDFVFLPSDTRILKAIQSPSTATSCATTTLFMRVRFFLPSLRGIRSSQAKHMLYLQLRRSILEHQLPCSFTQLVDLDGLALQAEFGDYNEREHGGQDYFLFEHYVPETMFCMVNDRNRLKKELIRSHKFKMGMNVDKAEEDFIILAQCLPHYGGHFYTAKWVLKDNTQRDVWLYISAQGINLYERGVSTAQCGPMLYEMFEWKEIQTLCYSKHYLCILPHSIKLHRSKLRKYKLKMDHKKSYFTFRLASLHHQFFLRLRTEFSSLTSLSAQFGIPLKDMKNETNSLYKLETMTNQYRSVDNATVRADTEFRIEFRTSSSSSSPVEHVRSDFDKECFDLENLEALQNKENENPTMSRSDGICLDSSLHSGASNFGDKRRGVKMGTRAYSTSVKIDHTRRVSRSMEAVNLHRNDDLEQVSLQSISIPCSEVSLPSTNVCSQEAYVIDCSTSSKCTENQFLPNFQETLSDTLQQKLNEISFADERVLKSVTVRKDIRGRLGIQITEGTDGKVYVQNVILGGPAHLTGQIKVGDQIAVVDGKSLVSMKYEDALSLLKATGSSVEFILSQNNVNSTLARPALLKKYSKSSCQIDLSDINESHLKSMRLERTMNKLKQMTLQQNENVEKHMTESCYDISNLQKYSNHREVPYHKHIRYEIEAENEMYPDFPHQQYVFTPQLDKIRSKSCMEINDRAIIVNAIPKPHLGDVYEYNEEILYSQAPIAFPRSLGLSRKWKGPVKYPVTPVKKPIGLSNPPGSHNRAHCNNSDDEQVFI